MDRTAPNLQTIDLDNCDHEPIHIPGSIQPHGVLLALDLDVRLSHASDNASVLIPHLPRLGDRPATADFWGGERLYVAASEMLESTSLGELTAPTSVQTRLGDIDFDVVLHSLNDRVILEFERRDEQDGDLVAFALLAHRSMAQLKGEVDLESALARAVETVRRLTGFHRVTAYRFRADDSGEIVAEAKEAALEPYLGRRFPAADIPVQARRLYTINTLRLIADVGDEQVRIGAADARGPPLDLSQSILRSVSPIHVEYLRNIDVAASMSVSIVVAGRLWGLIACHHRVPRRVPYAIRMACDVLANLLSSLVQTMTDKSVRSRRLAANDLRARVVEFGLGGDDLSSGLEPLHAAIREVVPCDRILFSQGSELRHAGMAAEPAIGLLRWLDAKGDDLVAIHELSALPEPLRLALHPLCGLLAMRYDRVNGGWMVLLRDEQATTITWSGPPSIAARLGPLGSRLTPAGSLAEWLQEVRGRAEPWSELDLELAGSITSGVTRATSARAAEMDRARTHLLAILGHDLRDPLQSISAAAAMLRQGVDHVQIGRRISASSDRMGRLISQVLDMSRLRGGLGLGLRFTPVDVSALLRELIDEASLAYPATQILFDIPDGVEGRLDEVRFAQVVVNLMGNARQHGDIGEPIMLKMKTTPSMLFIEVMNCARPLDPRLLAGLFEPMKRGALPNQRNPHGLGLGLYIASEAIKGHRGTLVYAHDGEHVVFTITVPLQSTE